MKRSLARFALLACGLLSLVSVAAAVHILRLRLNRSMSLVEWRLIAGPRKEPTTPQHEREAGPQPHVR